MINVTQLRPGVYFLHQDQPHKVLDYSHTHMGRGGGTIRVKIVNLNSGATTQLTFKGNDRVEELDVVKKQFQYLYEDGQVAVFMDPQTYQQLEVSLEVIGEKKYFLQESIPAWLLLWQDGEEDKVLDVDLPAKVTVTIAQAEPGEKGNSATNSYKQAKLANGYQLKVPLFVNEGDQVVISTVDGSYQERA